MLTNCEVIWREGIPEDTLMLTVPRTSYWLECKKWLNGHWRVTLLNPGTTYRKEVWHSIPEIDLDRVIWLLCRNSWSQKDMKPKRLLSLIRQTRRNLAA